MYKRSCYFFLISLIVHSTVKAMSERENCAHFGGAGVSLLCIDEVGFFLSVCLCCDLAPVPLTALCAAGEVG